MNGKVFFKIFTPYYKNMINLTVFFILVSLDGFGYCSVANFPGGNPAFVSYQQGSVLACSASPHRCGSFDGKIWSRMPDMKQQHCNYDSFSLNIDQGWLITSTKTTDDGCTNEAVSEVFTGKEWVPGPNHPPNGEFLYTCVANFNSSHLLYVSGYPFWARTWLFDLNTEKWLETGTLNQGRYDTACVSLGDQGILIAGGSRSAYPDKAERGSPASVELHDVWAGIWLPQPDLPQKLDRREPTLLNYNGEALGFFRNSREVYKRSARNGKWSVLKGVQLPNEFRGNLVSKVVLVPGTWSCN